MRDSLTPRERRLYNYLTIIKLANQILERRTELSPYQRQLVKTALAATENLTLELIEMREPGRSTPPSRRA
jgi:hypothetical protein